MKKLKLFAFVIILCIFPLACTETTHINFPFESTEIKNIEMYYCIDPMDAKKKILTEQNDINAIYRSLERISIKDKTTEPVAGSSLIAFRFNLSDETTYEALYWEVDKGGRIKTTGNKKDYFTSSDVVGHWDNFDYDVISVKEKEISAFF